MHQIDFYLDFVSPYAYLAFEQLPQALLDHSYQVRYRPLLFAGLLKHHGQRGPAEIEPKRDWTYRQVLWLARSLDIDLQLPKAHPFNPLALLRLAVACGDDEGLPNRYVTETIFHHVWRGGGDATEPQRLQDLTQQLSPRRDPNGDDVKSRLRGMTDEALDCGIFGVPSMRVHGKTFWGLDALPMLRACLDEDDWFAGPDWEAVAGIAARARRGL
jgi:2-hydroxychromene-2-carboxylate isomerase